MLPKIPRKSKSKQLWRLLALVIVTCLFGLIFRP